MLHTSGKESKASLTESSGLEGEECAQEEGEEVKQVFEAVSHKTLVAEQRKQVATSLERSHSEALSSSEAARPRVNLLKILQQGWDLRSVCILGCCSHWQLFHHPHLLRLLLTHFTLIPSLRRRHASYSMLQPKECHTSSSQVESLPVTSWVIAGLNKCDCFAYFVCHIYIVYSFTP